MNMKELATECNMSTKDMENIIRSMFLENVDPNKENIKRYLENYDARSINIKVSKNTQRILNSLKEGRETYEDVILRIATNEAIWK